MVFKIFDKKTGLEARANVNEELAQELNKAVINKFKRCRVYARFKDNVWTTDLTEMGSLSSKNQGNKYLPSMIDIFTKYTWVKSLKNKKN